MNEPLHTTNQENPNVADRALRAKGIVFAAVWSGFLFLLVVLVIIADHCIVAANH